LPCHAAFIIFALFSPHFRQIFAIDMPFRWLPTATPMPPPPLLICSCHYFRCQYAFSCHEFFVSFFASALILAPLRRH